MSMLQKRYNRVFAIGDIHGCAKTFNKLLFEELSVDTDDLIICVGDYVDRGPDSKGVVDTIIGLRDSGHEIICLRGNHEQIMMDSTGSSDHRSLWMNNGGLQTLQSFSAASYDQFENKYKEFFDETCYYYEWENYILVHAGLNFSINNPMSDHHAMLWTRETNVDSDWLGDRIIVHGHTPVYKDRILSQAGQRLNIDGGCVYPHREGMGWLVALELSSQQYSTVRNVE